MDRWLKLLVVPFLVLFLFAGGAMADNITIWDEIGDEPTSGDGEAGEAETGMQQNQEWWLESFNLDGNNLSVTGYFDFVGYFDSTPGYGGETGGDIFISINGAPQYGEKNNSTEQTNFGYDYVFDIKWDSRQYSLYSLGPDNETFGLPSVDLNDPRSAPYSYIPGGDDTAMFNGSLNVVENSLLYTVSGFDMSFIGADIEFWTHLTLSCGNDSMMGHGTTPVPEPATMLLLGTGLIGLAGASRKKFKK